MSTLLTRRSFLQKSATSGGGLILGFHFPLRGDLENSPGAASFAPNAWLEISGTGTIAIWCGRSEMGQGVQTSLPMLVAEELCCDWRRVKVIEADLDSKYGNQITGGSGSVRSSFNELRKAGAAAREMLLAAAASAWTVPTAECRAENGSVLHVPRSFNGHVSAARGIRKAPVIFARGNLKRRLNQSWETTPGVQAAAMKWRSALRGSPARGLSATP